MEPQGAVKGIELIVIGIEFLGVAIITFSFLYAIFRGVFYFNQKRKDWFDNLKIYIGKAIQMGLEFLVAADIIRTVAIEPTRDNLFSLGILVVVRTLLSWSITVEIEGCWPWQVATNRKGQAYE